MSKRSLNKNQVKNQYANRAKLDSVRQRSVATTDKYKDQKYNEK